MYRIREQMNRIREWSECGIVTRLLPQSDRLLVLNHPLLLSIIKIIESGLEELLSQAANAVCSVGRKSDCFLAHSGLLISTHHIFHSYICNLSSIYICLHVTSPIFTFVTCSCLLHCHLILLHSVQSAVCRLLI